MLKKYLKTYMPTGSYCLIKGSSNTSTKVIKNMVAGHHKLMLYSLKTFLGGVNLLGISL